MKGHNLDGLGGNVAFLHERNIYYRCICFCIIRAGGAGQVGPAVAGPIFGLTRNAHAHCLA